MTLALDKLENITNQLEIFFVISNSPLLHFLDISIKIFKILKIRFIHFSNKLNSNQSL